MEELMSERWLLKDHGCGWNTDLNEGEMGEDGGDLIEEREENAKG